MDFNFPQHLLPLLLLNTAFFGFFQYIDRIYKDAFKEVLDIVYDSNFNPDDNENESKIYKKAQGLYEELRNRTKIINIDLSKAYVGVYISAMAVYLFNCVCWFYPDYLKKLEKLWIGSLSIGIIALFAIIIWTWWRAKEMTKQIDDMREQKNTFLDLIELTKLMNEDIRRGKN
ncbi:MAG: hypothetical protein A2X93_02210 [Deltaproteobacteria bacterium GWC2_56_8]|nr:MAG: hypothetical protein A2X99_00360 [Deltaproteobacteria bacterium GWB2_55_19]OGP34178.1 MAG: hypothetical protein A2X93_02210 [Deltaproteobacteria bacterium GWC2_56_8]